MLMKPTGRAPFKRSAPRSRRAWLWRETPLVWMICLWGMAGVSVIGLLTDWFIPTHVKVVAADPAPTPAVHDDVMYTGSIIFVPSRGDLCWQRHLDNRTGWMRDVGYRPCEKVVSYLSEHTDQANYRANRFKGISAGFNERN